MLQRRLGGKLGSGIWHCHIGKNRNVSAPRRVSESTNITYYEMENRVLKMTRGMTPRPASKLNPFRASDKMKSEYEATTIIGTSSASCASYSKDA